MTGLSDLPLELISSIVDLTAASTPPFALHRTLSRLALIHPHFRNPAQARLFANITINTTNQLNSLATLLHADPTRRLGSYVRHLSAESEGDRLGTAQLNGLARACLKLDSIELSSMGVDLAVLGDLLVQAKHLKLDNVTLILAPGINVLPAVERLIVSNVHLCLPRHPPAHNQQPAEDEDDDEATLSLPSLTSLDFDYSLAPHLCPNLPSLSLDSLASPSLSSLTIHLLSNPATDGPTAPSPLSPTTTPPSPPTLALFPSLSSLTLLADSSYRTPLYFPLLRTLPELSPLTQFAVLVDMGYRDQELEVREMAAELAGAVRDGKGLGEKLEVLKLAKVFERFEGGEGMRALKEATEARGVRIEYAERK